MFSIADNLENVRQSIKKATISAARPLSSVRLLPVTKTRDAETLYDAMSLGLNDFGENYLNEALEKQQALAKLCSAQAFEQLCWHYIGPIQSNKTRLIAENFDWVQSVDRLKLAQRLNEQRPNRRSALNVLIQININAEDTKSGILLRDLDVFAAQVAGLPNLCLRGLMTLPKASLSTTELAHSYQLMAQAFEALKQQYATVDTLSMGMSADLSEAIAGGATMVRIGTALFGERV